MVPMATDTLLFALMHVYCKAGQLLNPSGLMQRERDDARSSPSGGAGAAAGAVLGLAYNSGV